jgi:hypothetical protein
MLDHFQTWSAKNVISRGIPFTTEEGHVRCMAHTINLAVQTILKCLKADASQETRRYLDDLGATETDIPRSSYTTKRKPQQKPKASAKAKIKATATGEPCLYPQIHLLGVD